MPFRDCRWPAAVHTTGLRCNKPGILLFPSGPSSCNYRIPHIAEGTCYCSHPVPPSTCRCPLSALLPTRRGPPRIHPFLLSRLYGVALFCPPYLLLLYLTICEPNHQSSKVL